MKENLSPADFSGLMVAYVMAHGSDGSIAVTIPKVMGNFTNSVTPVSGLIEINNGMVNNENVEEYKKLITGVNFFWVEPLKPVNYLPVVCDITQLPYTETLEVTDFNLESAEISGTDDLGGRWVGVDMSGGENSHNHMAQINSSQTHSLEDAIIKSVSGGLTVNHPKLNRQITLNKHTVMIPKVKEKILVFFVDGDPQKGYYIPFTI